MSDVEVSEASEEHSRESTNSSGMDVVGAIATYFSGIPPHLVKGVTSVAKALAGPVLKIPLAWVDGKAQEIKTGSDSRVALMGAATKQMIEHMDVHPVYAEAAMAQSVQKIIRYSRNKFQILQKTVKALENDPPEPQGQEEIPAINENWINNFVDHAERMSTDDMQELFARILAGELRKPSTFSIKTLNLVAQLDEDVATLFARLCSLACQLKYKGINDLRVAANGNPGTNTLMAFGFPLEHLNTLEEYGLISAQYNTGIDYGHMVKFSEGGETNPFLYRKKSYYLKPQVQWVSGRTVGLLGLAFTASGKELYEVVHLEVEDIKYTKYLEAIFANQGVEMVEIKQPEK